METLSLWEEHLAHQELVDQLQMSEQRLTALYEQTPAMLHSIDGQGRLLSVSDMWLKKLGYSRKEVIGRKSVEFMTPESQRRSLNIELPKFFKLGYSHRIPYQMVTRSGEVIDTELSAILERDASGRPIRSMAVIEDITDRLRAQRALMAEKERLARLIEGTRAGTWEWNIQSGETRFNERWAEILGYRLDELLPTTIETWLSFAHPADLEISKNNLSRHFSKEAEFYECEARMRHRDGHWVWVLDRGKVITWTPDGQPEWMFGTHIDITELKQQSLALKRMTEMFDRTCLVAGVGGWELDIIENQLWWSAETKRIHRVPDDYVPDVKSAIDFYAPESRSIIERAVQRASITGEGWDIELPLIRADHQKIWVRAVGKCELIDGVPVRLYGALQDITDRRQSQQKLQELSDRMTLATLSGGIGIWELDLVDGNLFADAQCLRLYGLDPRMVTPTMEVWGNLLHPEDRDRAFQVIQNSAALAQPFEMEFRIVHTSGEIRHLRSAGNVTTAKDGTPLKLTGVNWDVTKIRVMAQEILHRASHDALTGLINRSEFESRLSQALNQPADSTQNHALLYIDLDQFKIVNDTCGHCVGDTLLKQVSDLLIRCLRSGDSLARLGGDEFGALLMDCHTERALEIANSICEELDAYRFAFGERRFRVGASIGLVPIDQRWINITGILQAADSACYAAKDAGRNRVHTWHDTDESVNARHSDMQWANRIEQALDENLLELHYQRIAPIQTRSNRLHAEVLVRMKSADGPIPPGAFLPAAERFHLASRLDRWVLERSVAWLQNTSADEVELLCINLSGQSIGDRSFHRFTVSLFQQMPTSVLKRLCLEITETSAVTNMADATLFVEQARALGVQVALDDFGAGASSFGYLKKLQVDILKIDGQFVKNLLSDALDDVAVRCFVEVAKLMGMRIVAEYVDNQLTVDKLQSMGVDFAQGYFIHKPEPLDLANTQGVPRPYPVLA